MRTLILVNESDSHTKMDTSVCNTLVSKLIYLVLDLQYQGIEELPESVDKLIHLRYLDLSKNGLVTLPKSVAEIYNLQTLKLNSCMWLAKLSGNFGRLINLRRFEIDECYSLTCMPLGLENLIQLESLSRFIVGKDCSTELHALRRLTSLRGQLLIKLSGKWATNIPKAPKVVMQAHLEKLQICWTKPIQTYHLTCSFLKNSNKFRSENSPHRRISGKQLSQLGEEKYYVGSSTKLRGYQH